MQEKQPEMNYHGWLVGWGADGSCEMAMAGGRWLVGWEADCRCVVGDGSWAGRRTAAAAMAGGLGSVLMAMAGGLGSGRKLRRSLVGWAADG